MSTTANLGITKLDAGLRQPEVVINDAFDDFDAAIGGAWASWTPTWTNLSVGNGTVVAKYIKVSKVVTARLSIVFGSTTSISGSVEVSLPVTRIAYGGTAGITRIGDCRLFDQSASTTLEGEVLNISTTAALLAALDASGTYLKGVVLSSTVPFTWTTSDELTATFTYEAA